MQQWCQQTNPLFGINTKVDAMERRGIEFWANLFTTAAYYVLTIQIIVLIRDSKIVPYYGKRSFQQEAKKWDLYYLFGILALFCSFISLCGSTHLLHLLCEQVPDNDHLEQAHTIVLVMCAAVSLVTVLVSYKVFPLLVSILSKFELSSEGHLQHPENYLIEVVELINEGVMVLSEELKFVRGNQAFKLLFGKNAVGKCVKEFLHPEDRALFNSTVTRVLESFNFTPATIEVRIRRNNPRSLPVPGASPGSTPSNRRRNSNSRLRDARVYCADDSMSRRSLASGSTPTTRSAPDVLSHTTTSAAAMAGLTSPIASSDEEYLWIECTMCKGKRLTANEDFEYDIKMVARNIDDKKKRAMFQSIVEGTEERARINESKMRYISCIAHDLKTPLQSFSFTLDLLKQTNLFAEQRDYIEQANVAVDLMKLTISQTMDISKALTGAKLTPRRTTVYLSSVLQRVKIIITGYGKQVPVHFEVAPEVSDTIITDEEWLWQMLLNLLTNACKYTQRGRIDVKLSLRQDIEVEPEPVAHDRMPPRVNIPRLVMPTTEQPATMLLCEVIDTGIGINSEKIGHTFDAFAQVQEGQVTGTGLGLFGVRTRAEGLQGTCGARHNTESSTGTGTVLWFAIPYTPDRAYTSLEPSATSTPRTPPSPSTLDTLPTFSAKIPLRAPSPFSSHQLHHVPSSHSTDNTVSERYIAPFASLASASKDCDDLVTRTEELIREHKLTAMVVEDTATVRKLMERLLLKMGFASVQCYENGSKGLEAMIAEQVDIVFSDVQMPIMTGPEMVNRFRKFEAEALNTGLRTCRQVIVAVTANGAECGQRGEGGFDEICPKPLQRTEIYHIVNDYLQDRVTIF